MSPPVTKPPVLPIQWRTNVDDSHTGGDRWGSVHARRSGATKTLCGRPIPDLPPHMMRLSRQTVGATCAQCKKRMDARAAAGKLQNSRITRESS